MTANRHNIPVLADRLASLAEDYKSDVARVMDDAKAADVDTSALRRLVSWSGKDCVQRAEQEAIDEQYRFLAGERDEPAALPAEGLLSQAVRLYADKLTVRQVAGVLEVSVGKAQKLRTLAAAFSVHVRVNVNTTREMTEADLGEWLPSHDAETGELPREMTADDLGDPLLVIDKERGRFRDKVRTLAAGIKPMSAGHTVIVNPDAEIDLTIPDFLRRERASA